MWRTWVEGVITGRHSGIASQCYRLAATLPSYCFAAAIKGRHLLYDQGILTTQEASVPVISVGNLVCGGTGKTQFVMLLAQLLMQQGKRVGVLSRGYKGKLRQAQRIDPLRMDVSICGDEPWLIAKRLPKACVVVGVDRVKASQLAIKEGSQVLLLDDGMQYRRLKRNIEIVMLDGQDPFFAQQYLPKGCLRELPSRLKHADLVVFVGKSSSKIHQWTQASCMEVQIVHDGVFDLQGQQMPLPKRVGLFCGLGKPHRFVQTVKEMGCEVVKTCFLADHEKITRNVLGDFAKQAQELGAEALLCTEKDWVKGVFSTSLPIAWVRTKMIIIQGENVLKSILERNCI